MLCGVVAGQHTHKCRVVYEEETRVGPSGYDDTANDIRYRTTYRGEQPQPQPQHQPPRHAGSPPTTKKRIRGPLCSYGIHDRSSSKSHPPHLYATRPYNKLATVCSPLVATTDERLHINATNTHALDPVWVGRPQRARVGVPRRMANTPVCHVHIHGAQKSVSHVYIVFVVRFCCYCSSFCPVMDSVVGIDIHWYTHPRIESSTRECRLVGNLSILFSLH